ncbi:Hydroxyacylglutathione hydrolase [Methylobrevis pamukkalensis]|uniref:Hydroxyacylglutathione hydrolase n=1 Tax=Methylobrevis pamukkalensis TaxID=1439726 RepID=A0A1E3H8K7_9HYPH|nr:Hydroxyacylglutathione hydrolase [Methylobrevis pamukkalensis]
MEDIQIALVPCLSDNYAVLLHVPSTGATILVDAPAPQPIAQTLTRNGWDLTCILITHHHSDHIDGLMSLKSASNATVVGPALDQNRIPGIDVAVNDGDEINASGLAVKVIATPGHTSGHISFWFPDMGVVFTADSLFALGCGRIFEGTPEIMMTSLKKLAALPPETRVFCGHEYTLSTPASPSPSTRPTRRWRTGCARS